MINKAWPVTAIVFLAGVIFSAGNFKVPPTMVAILGEMNIGTTMGGWLMSLSGLAGIILALPTGGIMMKTGPKKLGVFALICALIGNIVGAIAPTFTVLMLSRLIEGIGFGLIGVVGPAIIAVWFSPEKRGLPMAIWTCWVGVGLLFIFNITNVIMPQMGWRGDWWLMAFLSAFILILFILFVQVPKAEIEDTTKKVTGIKTVSMIEGFKSPSSWLLGVIFLLYSFGVASMTTYAPTYLVESVGMDGTTANAYSSVITFGMIFGGILMGFILNKVKNHKLLLLMSTLIAAIFFSLTFEIDSPAWIPFFMVAIGLAYSLLPPTIFTLAPEAAFSPATIGITMGIINLGQNLGGVSAPIVIGSIVESHGGAWNSATTILAAIGVLSIVFTVLYIILISNKSKHNANIQVRR